MFYRALGIVVWRVMRGYLQYRFPNYRRVGAGVTLFAAALAAGWAVTRENGDA